MITEVKRDRVGLLWIGTREGLYLHDGHRFRKFQHEPGQPSSMASNGVRSLHEDALGRLWVGTNSAGLSQVDRARWTFRHFRHDSADPGSLSHDSVLALADAEDGRLWVGTQSGLDLFSPDTGRATRTPLVPGGGAEHIESLHRDSAGTLWVGTRGQGLFRRRAGERGFTHVPLEAGSPGARHVVSLAEDGAGGTWVGTRDGLHRLLPGAPAVRRAVLSPPEVAAAISDVTALEPDGQGRLWVGTFGAGLFRVDTATGMVRAADLVPGAPGRARRIDQGALELDGRGGLFIGTFGEGLFHTSLRPSAFQAFRAAEPGRGSGLSSEDVWAVLPDGEGQLLVGSFGGGVDRLTVETGQVEPLRLTVPSGASLTDVVSLLRTRDGALWVGLMQGVYRQESSTGRSRLYRELGGGPRAAPDTVSALLEDSRGRLWLGTGGNGLHLYRPGTDDFLAFQHAPANPRSLSDDSILVLMEDHGGRLWVGTRSGGLNVCAAQGDTLDCERQLSGPGPGLGRSPITSLLEDSSGAVWVGTAGDGLHRLRLDAAGKPEHLSVWTRGEGLIDEHVMALARAPDGAIWVATRGGLSRHDVVSGHFENYSVNDGLPTAAFNVKAATQLGGRLYWGTAKGVVALDPSVRPERGPPPPLIVTAIEGLEPEARPTRPVWELSELEVPWHQPFSLEFAVLDYERTDAEYAYRLSADGAWRPLGGRSQLTFHTLPPGEHLLQLRGRGPGLEWSETRSLTLFVLPPLWQRNDVRFGALGLAVLILVSGLVWRTRFLERRNEELRRLQAEREQALEEARSSRDHMRRLTMRLEAAKEEERKHLARELHDEFGQALTAVKLNVGLVAATARLTGPLAARLPDAIALVERLITQVRALSVDLRPPQLDELGLAEALESYLRAAARRGGVDIVFTAAAPLPSLGVERDIVIFRVIQEAVTNALRHAEARRIDVRLESTRTAIRLQVRDDGKGFSADSVLASGTSRSFGLFGMGERVRDMGGRLEVKSQPGEGTCVQAEVPLAVEEHPKEETHARVADG